MADPIPTLRRERLGTHRRSVAPLVSVIVSTRGHAKWVAATARAVLSQDLEQEVELVVCDDASPDRTWDELRGVVAEADAQSWAGPRSVTCVRLPVSVGPAGGRNAALESACGRYLAFTDSDCLPDPGWLSAALAAAGPDVGLVQGRTVATERHGPLFEHHVETLQMDGRFATANVVYLREALGDHRFDPACFRTRFGISVEDVDLAWRVLEGGEWRPVFAPGAVVRHRVVPISPWRWMLWPTRLAALPELVARHPGLRRHLFAGVWVRPMHLWFELALAGLVLSRRRPAALVLALPYVIAFGRERGLNGRCPPAKALAYVTRDAVSLAALIAASIRYRRLVL